MAQLNRANSFAALLLLVGVMRHYGWVFADPSVRGMTAKGLGAVLVLLLVWAQWLRGLRGLFTLVAMWLTFEESQIAICSAMYLYEPWEVPANMGICSARTGIDLGAVGIVIVAVLAGRLSTLLGAKND